MASLKNTTINDTGNLTLPVGSTAQRPSASTGMTRFNSDLGIMEYYGSAGWTPLAQVRLGDSNSTTGAVLSMQDFDILRRPAGNYYFIKPADATYTPSILNLYYTYDLQGTGVGWVKVFESPYNGTATTNLIDQSIVFTQMMVRRTDGAFWDTLGPSGSGYGWLFNTRNDTTTGTTGTKSGYRAFFGYAGGHGIYNTVQNPCSWGDSAGAIGAGWNGSSCGSFPNGLLWGTGQSGTAVYANLSGTWQIWLRWS